MPTLPEAENDYFEVMGSSVGVYQSVVPSATRVCGARTLEPPVLAPCIRILKDMDVRSLRGR